jgi:ribosomal-protein-alanine N-acetyltransferase
MVAPMHPFAEFVLPAQRVTLRFLTAADAPAIYGIFSDRDVMRFWSRAPMVDPQEANAHVQDVCAGYRIGDALQLGIGRNSDGALIGTCTLFHFHWGSRRAELGYALARAAWGQGLMHEALNALVTYAFGRLDLNRIEADIDPRNAASARSLERLGFRKEGHLRERWRVDGEVSDSDLYGLLRIDWPPRVR